MDTNSEVHRMLFKTGYYTVESKIEFIDSCLDSISFVADISKRSLLLDKLAFITSLDMSVLLESLNNKIIKNKHNEKRKI